MFIRLLFLMDLTGVYEIMPGFYVRHGTGFLELLYPQFLMGTACE